ncbi:hypothetical protein SAY86_027444 [Trapa natans]|uniref:Bulb-type lectin domain-containing protein n=1 Tax=Trapa natans TaxID=22666 RepID=A0AAN7QJ54_TRANT|nr:hypothetical protein SAY86_027444 [Trapa natans]
MGVLLGPLTLWDLRSATNNFERKLGEGGFGCVFEGRLLNGTRVAVKHLQVLGRIKKSFLAEMETIGNIHHVNLQGGPAEEDRLPDTIDEHLDDIQLNGMEAVQTVKLAAWCLQADCEKRPSMPMIMKMLSSAQTMSARRRSLFLCRTFLQLVIVLILASDFLCSVKAQPFDYPTASLSTKWKNSATANHSVSFTDGSTVRAILLRGTFGPKYACGFYCYGDCNNYLFAIFIVQTNSASYITLPSAGFPQVVWSANRNSPVKVNSTLELTSNGDLVLQDADGTIAWSSNTSGKGVVGLNLTEEGNLVLFNEKNGTVWQSFDYPTDSLVPGQRLSIGQKLTPNISSTNWTAFDLISFTFTRSGIFGRMEADPPQIYYQNDYSLTSSDTAYVEYINGSLALFLNSKQNKTLISIPSSKSAQYMRLGPDGHLRVYEWNLGNWDQVTDLLTGYLGDCAYPTACGDYGICSRGQCSCPASDNGTIYFKQINSRQPDLGCSEVSQLSCSDSQHQTLIELKDITYFTFTSDLQDTNPELCKKACEGNCSCKAAIFQYGTNSSSGSCYLPSKLFSLMNNEQDKTRLNSTTYIKVQNLPIAVTPSSNPSTREERLQDIVDKNSEDMMQHAPEAVNMLTVAAWCLQGDTTRRPSMSAVIKVLEGVADVEVELDYDFLNPARAARTSADVGIREKEYHTTTPLLPSVLSGPR